MSSVDCMLIIKGENLKEKEKYFTKKLLLSKVWYTFIKHLLLVYHYYLYHSLETALPVFSLFNCPGWPKAVLSDLYNCLESS